MIRSFILGFVCLFSVASQADEAFESAKRAIRSFGGCYLVDYSYTETASLREGYVTDSRVYDVNRNKSIKEWIVPIDVSPTRIRLQHVLFGTNLAGEIMQGSLLKHQAEDWEYEPRFIYNFVSPSHWAVEDTSTMRGAWVRKVTNLDDGLRYQCAANWNLRTAYPEWSCANFSPIPGRETRDMARRDYNTLQRQTRIIAYGKNWLERQDNVKTVWTAESSTPLAQEFGKTWYVRLPDSECRPAINFMARRTAFWDLLREAWDEVLVGDRPFVEMLPAGQPPRFAAMFDVEERYLDLPLSRRDIRVRAKLEIKMVIDRYRAQNASALRLRMSDQDPFIAPGLTN